MYATLPGVPDWTAIPSGGGELGTAPGDSGGEFFVRSHIGLEIVSGRFVGGRSMRIVLDSEKVSLITGSVCELGL